MDHPDSTITAIIRVHYAGPAQKFAWLIPIPGTPTVGVSSSTVFERLEAATAPQYWLEYGLEQSCIPPDADAGIPKFPDDAAPSDGPIATIDRGAVGPYDYVTIAVDPTAAEPAQAAIEWLRANGYDLTSVDSTVLSPYLRNGQNLLAFKLSKDSEEGAVRPVMLTYQGDRPILPIRPAAVAAAELGMHIWVLGPSQAVPVNYKSLVLNDARIDWLSAKRFSAGTLPSGGAGPFGTLVQEPLNYDAVVAAATREAGGRGFVTELGGPASQYRDKLWSPADQDLYDVISTQGYADGLDAVITAIASYPGWDGLRDAIEGSTQLPAGVTIEDFSANPNAHRGAAKVDTAKFLELLAALVIRPVADAAELLYRAPYLTRLYSIVRAADMTEDPAFDYNFELAQVSDVHIAKQSLDCSAPGELTSATWRVELPQGAVVRGEGISGWPVPGDTLPANLKVVRLSASGSGTVETDNSEIIGARLADPTGAVESTTLPPPRSGLLIGGTQRVVGPNAPGDGPAGPSRNEGCNVSAAGAGASNYACWLLAGTLIALRRRRVRQAAIGYLAALLLAACSDDAAPSPAAPDAAVLPMSLEQLRDPATCKSCHPIHYREWSASMHAYSARDPVFLAMNKRGQRETNGELGDFCVKCHAPMAVLDGRTTDGLNLEELPDLDRGVSCYFCHNAKGVEGTHNNPLELANDDTMRGPIRDPLQPDAHRAEYSELFDSMSPKSSAMCGGCHDIVMPTGVHLERTFEEFRAGIFSKSASPEMPQFVSCTGCHMPDRNSVAAVFEGARERTIHEHLWPGIDVALIDFPGREAMRSAVEDCQLGVASITFFTLEVTPPDIFTFQIETNAGHNQPSGAAQDRRMWLEFLAYDANGELMEEVSSGNIADGALEEQPKDHPDHDPHLLMFRDRIFDAKGKPVHMFWEAEKSKQYPLGYESNLLPVARTTYIEGKRAVVKQYRARQPNGALPARITARLRIRAIGLDVLHDLVESGDLDPKIAAEMPTLDFGAKIEWTPEQGVNKPINAEVKSDCGTYQCLLDPNAPNCP